MLLALEALFSPANIELVAIAAPVLWGGYQYIIKPLFQQTQLVLRNLQAITILQETVLQLTGAVTVLQQELKPNGGSSLRDAVDRVEQIVQLNQNTLKVILDLLNAGFFVTDASGDYTHVNPHWQRLTGVDIADAMGHGWVVMVHPDDRVAFLDDWMLAVEDGRAFHRRFRMLQHKTKTVFEVYCHTAPLHDSAGELLGFVGTLVEVE